jgi:ferritin-like protein
MLYYKLLHDKNAEVMTKYFYLYMYMRTIGSGHEDIIIDIDKLAQDAGLTRHKIYRARSQLKEMRILNYAVRYSPETGKKVGEIYKLVG